MFELFFIVMLQDLTIREQWPDSYASQVACMDDGWSKADEHKQTIVERYPDLQGFDIECMESVNTIQSHVSLIIGKKQF